MAVLNDSYKKGIGTKCKKSRVPQGTNVMPEAQHSFHYNFFNFLSLQATDIPTMPPIISIKRSMMLGFLSIVRN